MCYNYATFIKQIIIYQLLAAKQIISFIIRAITVKLSSAVVYRFIYISPLGPKKGRPEWTNIVIYNYFER